MPQCSCFNITVRVRKTLFPALLFFRFLLMSSICHIITVIPSIPPPSLHRKPSHITNKISFREEKKISTAVQYTEKDRKRVQTSHDHRVGICGVLSYFFIWAVLDLYNFVVIFWFFGVLFSFTLLHLHLLCCSHCFIDSTYFTLHQFIKIFLYFSAFITHIMFLHNRAIPLHSCTTICFAMPQLIGIYFVSFFCYHKKCCYKYCGVYGDFLFINK